MIWIFRLRSLKLTNSRPIRFSKSVRHEQHKKAKASMDTTPVQSALKRTPIKALPEKQGIQLHFRQKERHCKKGRRGLNHHRQLLHLSGKKKGPQHWKIGVDVNPPWPWSARERTLIKTMASYLKKSEQFHVGFNEPKHFLLSPENYASSILSFAEKACDEGGRKKFAVLETKRGVEVAEKGHFFKAPQENYRAVRNPVEYVGFWTAQAEVHEWSPGLGRQDLGGGK